MQSNYYSAKYVDVLSSVSIKRNPHGSCSISSALSLLIYSLIQMLLNRSPFICRGFQLQLNDSTLLFNGVLHVSIKVEAEVVGFNIYLREKMSLSLAVADATWHT